jgi:molybdenum cofactor guanylyltransferase
MAKAVECTGIILAGGKSLRMGSDKGLMHFGSKQLVAFAIEALKPHCSNIIIAANNEAYIQFGHEVVRDTHAGIGPMGGLHAGLLSSKTEHNLVLSCDMPLVNEALMGWIFSHKYGYQAVIPVKNGQQFTVCAYYHRSVLQTIESEIHLGLYKMKLMLNKIKVNALPLDPRFEGKLVNINSPSDFDALKTCPNA